MALEGALVYSPLSDFFGPDANGKNVISCCHGEGNLLPLDNIGHFPANLAINLLFKYREYAVVSGWRGGSTVPLVFADSQKLPRCGWNFSESPSLRAFAEYR